jgi:hypothetical protein
MLCLLTASTVSFAAEKEGLVEKIISAPAKVLEPVAGAKANNKEVKDEKKEPTRAELVEHLKMALEHQDEVLGFIPELKKEKDAKGNIDYLYKGKRIEDIDEKSLHNLNSKVRNELARMRAERLNRQLESIRQAGEASRAAQAGSRVPHVVTPPPQPPQVPRQPPSPPQIPKPPAQPPRR